MSHPFGDLLRQHLTRKHGISQNKLAMAINQDAAIISAMSKGQRLTGPQARERILRIIAWFHDQGVLTTKTEADKLLEAAGMARLNNHGSDLESELAQTLPQISEDEDDSILVFSQTPGVSKTNTQTPISRLTTATLGIERIQQLHAIPLDFIPSPAPFLHGSRMPLSYNPLFVGREGELRELARVLKAGNTAAIGQIAAATGLGGIGKTQLAAEFVHRYGQFFAGGVFWLSFADPAAVPAEVAACGGIDGMRLSTDFDTLPLNDQVRLVLSEWHSPLPRLLVFDNCEDETLLDQWRPKYGGCRVLVTSRQAAWDTALGVRTLPLSVLPRPQSIALLRAFRSDLAENDSDLNAIAAELGDLPLALHLAGSFLKRYQQDVTAVEYLDELRTATVIAHESLEGTGISPTKHDLSVARTFRLSYERLDVAVPGDALALSILTRAAYFAPGEPIPRDLLRATLELSVDERHAKRQMTQGVRRLASLGLVEEETEGTVRVHRLVAAFVRAVAPDATAQTAVEQTVLNVASELNIEGYPTPMLALQPHLRTVTNAALQRQDEAAGALGINFGYHLQMVGAYAEAQHYLEQALAIYQRVLGAEHPNTAASLNNLGGVLQAQGHYVEAQHYYEQALAIRQRVLGTDHPNTAQSLSNLGGVLQAQGHYAQAQHYLEQALAIYQRVLGAEHPNTAASLNNLGGVLQAQGHYVEAQHYYEQALAIYQHVLGADHPDAAASLNNLGTVLQGQGHYVEAQHYYEQALAIYQHVLGADHPDAAANLNNLSSVLQAQGHYVEAQHYYEQAIAIHQRVLGSDYPDTYTPVLFSQPVQLYSCFISYSHADRSFARRLHDALQGRGIRCWLDEHQLLPDHSIYDEIDRGIRLWDKILLCTSEHSLKSWWVDNEIDKAFTKEQQLMKERGTKIRALIPLNLDDTLWHWQDGKADELRSRLASDFTGWEQDNAKFEREFEQLVRVLRTDEGREEPPRSRL